MLTKNGGEVMPYVMLSKKKDAELLIQCDCF